MYRYEVVIETSPEDMAMANPIFEVISEGYPERLKQLDPVLTVLRLRQAVFHKGEVLIIDDNGREVTYPGRKTSKWYVTTEVFGTLEAALVRAEEVM